MRRIGETFKVWVCKNVVTRTCICKHLIFNILLKTPITSSVLIFFSFGVKRCVLSFLEIRSCRHFQLSTDLIEHHCFLGSADLAELG